MIQARGRADSPPALHGTPMSQRILIVEDEPALLRALRINLRARGYDVATAPDRPRGARRGARGGRPTRSCSISASPTWTAPGDQGAARLVGRAGHRALRPGRPATRSARWTPAPMTTSPSRSAWRNCSPGCGPRSAARSPRRQESFPIGQYVVDLTAYTIIRTRTARPSRVPAAGGSSPHPDGVAAPGDPAARPWPAGQLRHAAERGLGARLRARTHYLRFHMARLRRKLEDDPPRPRHLLTEPGMGYRYQP